ncbi:hypothetical protein Cni_G08199 [Canna indica]|uniref:C2 NT-type domain-containing protein n=1 Tax=Canna indica TaxID=4628 RepID=A0AAQ3Q858_9LILI|nr:hypothetical protein Cni_G08199 [Canna indica]
MVSRMMRWRPWPPLLSKKFRVRLVVKRVEGVGAGEDSAPAAGRKVVAEVRWKGPKVALSSLRRTVKRHRTREEEVGDRDVVEWNEEFEIVCTLTAHREAAFHPWEVAFNVFNGFNHVAKNKETLLGMALVNIAEFISASDQEIELNLPLSIPGAPESHASLHLALSMLELRDSQDSSDIMQRAVTSPILPPSGDVLPSEKDELSALKAGLKKVKILTEFVSARKSKKTCQDDDSSDSKCSTRSDDVEYTYPFDTDSLDDDLNDEAEYTKEDTKVRKSFSYGTLASVNNIGYEMKIDGEYEDWVYYNHRRSDVGCSNIEDKMVSVPELSLSKRSILPWKKRKLGFRAPKPKGEPLLKKAYEEGGDDIDYDRRLLSSSDESHCRHKGDGDSAMNLSSASDFGDDYFVIGSWESKELVSRDGHMQLATQIFFASIDQRSERASGESACTALVAVIADWFHRNRDVMPIKSQFDSLIREGSFEWRKLCENQANLEHFPDKHFDLDTVLQAKIRPLSVNSDKSLIGFFHPEGSDCDSGFDFLHLAMSFDSMWDEISRTASECFSDGRPQIYIVSWNDHFFVLKVERDAYYIIDTLGERLYEGCQQAYILKFDDSTCIHKVPSESKTVNSELAAGGGENGGTECLRQENGNVAVERGDLVCRGKESCKEYIKSFLAAIPVRELQEDIKKGRMSSTPLHHRLQIEFHYTELSNKLKWPNQSSSADTNSTSSRLVEPVGEFTPSPPVMVL